MTMTTCDECGKSLSTKAKTCPHCGAIPASGPSVAFVLIVVVLIGIAISAIFRSDPPPKPPKTTAELAADWRYQMAGAAAIRLKKNLREPDSLEIISIFSDEKANTLCLKYRARNGFGGFSIEYWIITDETSSQEADDWNRHCTGEMFDVTSVKHLI